MARVGPENREVKAGRRKSGVVPRKAIRTQEAVMGPGLMTRG
jgi:hypothetical protein